MSYYQKCLLRKVYVVKIKYNTTNSIQGKTMNYLFFQYSVPGKFILTYIGNTVATLSK